MPEDTGVLSIADRALEFTMLVSEIEGFFKNCPKTLEILEEAQTLISNNKRYDTSFSNSLKITKEKLDAPILLLRTNSDIPSTITNVIQEIFSDLIDNLDPSKEAA